MSTLSPVSDSTYALPVPALLPATSSATSPDVAQPAAATGQDGVELSLAGRIALGGGRNSSGADDSGVNGANSNSDQGQLIYSQQSYLQPEASEKQRQEAAADGTQSQNQPDAVNSQQDTNASPSAATAQAVSPATSNVVQQGGRVISLEKAGDITTGQMSALLAQIGIGYQQAEMGV